MKAHGIALALALQVIVMTGPKPTPEEAAALMASHAGPGTANVTYYSRPLPEGIVGEPLPSRSFIDYRRALAWNANRIVIIQRGRRSR